MEVRLYGMTMTMIDAIDDPVGCRDRRFHAMQ